MPHPVTAEASPTTSCRRTVPALGVAMLGFFVVALDAQVINVALPDIRAATAAATLRWHRA